MVPLQSGGLSLGLSLRDYELHLIIIVVTILNDAPSFGTPIHAYYIFLINRPIFITSSQ